MKIEFIAPSNGHQNCLDKSLYAHSTLTHEKEKLLETG